MDTHLSNAAAVIKFIKHNADKNVNQADILYFTLVLISMIIDILAY